MKWLTGISVFICALSSLAQDERKEVFMTQMSGVSEVTAIQDIPAHLKPQPGKLSLLADFQNQKKGATTIYFVNATKKTILVPRQDGDLYCKREAKAKNGEWRRCDSHEYSWCGNSYLNLELPAGSFLSWEQKLDSKHGEARPVRFRLFSGPFEELESNEGMGKVGDEDLTFCRYDAMAMQFGPFEDVVAVAMGEIGGSQGSSVRENSGIGALERFRADERLFPVLKKVVANLIKHPNPKGNSSNDYDTCLRVLAKAVETTLSEQEAWDYVVGHVNDPKFPWSDVAMDWLVFHFERYWQEKKDLAEKILPQPNHKALHSALPAYAKLAGKDESGPWLEAISKDKRYPEDERDYARELWAKLFVNPYLRIWIDQTDPLAVKESGHDGESQKVPFLLPGAGGREVEIRPLTSVTIANISPQTLTLPVEKAEDLIFVRMVDVDDGGTPMPVGGSGQLRLKPGEKIVLHDVQWWRGIDPAKINTRTKEPFDFSLHVVTPGLWDVPAEAGPYISVDGKELLKVLRKKP